MADHFEDLDSTCQGELYSCDDLNLLCYRNEQCESSTNCTWTFCQ